MSFYVGLWAFLVFWHSAFVQGSQCQDGRPAIDGLLCKEPRSIPALVFIDQSYLNGNNHGISSPLCIRYGPSNLTISNVNPRRGSLLAFDYFPFKREWFCSHAFMYIDCYL
jgi:hypothetical protein